MRALWVGIVRAKLRFVQQRPAASEDAGHPAGATTGPAADRTASATGSVVGAGGSRATRRLTRDDQALAQTGSTNPLRRPLTFAPDLLALLPADPGLIKQMFSDPGEVPRAISVSIDCYGDGPDELGPGRRDSATLWGVLIAQALGEYVALSALVGALTQAAVSAETFIRGMEPSTWAMIGGGVLLLWFLISRVR